VRQPLRGGGGGFLGPLLDPLCVQGEPGSAAAIPAVTPPADIDARRQERRSALLSVVNQCGSSTPATRAFGTLQRQAVLLAGSCGKTFSLAGEPPNVQDRYGTHRFGKALLLARRLAEAGVPMIAVHFNEMTVCDGWDTHTREHFPALKDELLPMLDQGLSALLEDLQQRGLAGETVVVVMGEFGRTPRINAAAGRDHWGLCQSVLLAGGGIKGGQVVGTSDRSGAYPTSNPLDPVDIHATVYHVMGLGAAAHLRDHLNRPWSLSTGKVVSRLV
jgi:hypothetical protein